jgi:DNA-binding transcriptional LysR family regulator
MQRFMLEQPRVSMDVVLADRTVNPLEEGFDIAIGALPELYGQVRDFPLVLYRSAHWRGLIDWMRESPLKEGWIEESDLERIHLADSPEEVVHHACGGDA